MLADPAEAEDVAQATFERLWRARLMEEDVKTVSAWIYRTSTRLAIDQLRRRKVRERGPAAPEAPSLHDQAIARATLADIALRVPKRELRTVVLHRVDGLTQPEVAEVLGISERSVRRHLVRFDARRFER